MITIFLLLGLALLGGGVAAIVDGWPYLVLERGFTQVIIGTVAATGGTILLALSWVLVELRRVKSSVLARMAAVPARVEPREHVRSEPLATETAPAATAAVAVAEQPSLPGLGTVAAGAGLVAAGGAVVAALRESPEPAAEEPVPEPVINDLFEDILTSAGPVAGELAAATGPIEPAEPEAAPATDEAETEADAKAEADSDEPVIEPPEVAPDAITAAITAAFALELDEDRMKDQAAETDEAAEEPVSAAGATGWPPADAPKSDEPVSAREMPAADDFSDLRQSLAAKTGSAEPSGTAAENVFDMRDREIDEAAAWMAPAFGRHEPTFGEPEKVPDEPAVPRWPPLTTPAANLGPDAEGEAPEAEGGPDAEFERERREPMFDELAPQPAPDDAEESEPADELEEPEAEPDRSSPAASEEGIVGAYQVGDTHFTMYADGSIRARTPEGEYTFASMDELKAYLASEKSRLGG